MNFVLPRVILGNRGDLASRWGVLHALQNLGVDTATVFYYQDSDLPDITYKSLRYRPMRNMLLDRDSFLALRDANTVLWAVGLDMQDDSSLARILYLAVIFRMYRLLNLRIWILFQGAGPLATRFGKMFARLALNQVDKFVARDPGTYDLIGNIAPNTERILAHDAIFLPGFENDLEDLSPEENKCLAMMMKSDGRPVIGLNVRQWFHFASSLLPYQLARRQYLKRSEEGMKRLISATNELINMLREQLNARVLLISAYQPGIVPWEDDQTWLGRIQSHFIGDSEVQLTNASISLSAYFALMSRLDLMIGMRLHSTLIALRYGVPAVNISYTLKGNDILKHLGLSENVIDLHCFLEAPQLVCQRAVSILGNLPEEREKIGKAVNAAVEINMSILHELIGQKST